jgi:GNAT superfamily N-acetyltransferase
VLQAFRAGRTALIIERVSEQDRDVARGLYGRALPVRPGHHHRVPHTCLRGHDLTIAGAGSSYHHRYALTEITCVVCYALRDPLASWCLVNPAHQHTLATAPRTGLVLVRIPPATRGGTGQVRLWIDGVAVADIDLAICGPCRRGVLEHVRTDEPHRRRGYGRVLVAAALSLAPPATFRWSTTKINDDPVARAFWAGIGWPGELGRPAYCTDMERASGTASDA